MIRSSDTNPDTNPTERARANGHEPMFYLWWMLERLPKAQSPDDYRELLPTPVSPRDL